MKGFFLLSLLVLTGTSFVYAQFNHHNRDTTNLNIRIRQDLASASSRTIKSLTWQRTITAPLILTSVGLYSVTDNDFLSREEVKEERDEYMPKFRHRVDDYLQFAPIAAVYGLNAMGIKGKTD